LNTFDRHLLREWLQILGLWLAATCGLLFVQICYDDFRTLREAGATAADFWRYFLVTMPGFLAIVLPSALLLSLLFTLTKMHKSNELTAMRAAGVGFLRLTAPVWFIGVIACCVAWWLNSVVVPWSVEASRGQAEELRFRSQARVMPADHVGAVYATAFDNPRDNRMWFFNRYSAFTHRAYGVTVSQLDRQRHETRRIVAAQAWADPGRGGWVFANGRDLQFDPESGEQMSSAPFTRLFVAGYREDPRLMLLTTARPIDLSFFELKRLIDYFAAANPSKGIPYAVRYFGLIADTVGPLIVIAIAIPFSVAGVRVNPAVGVSKAIGLFLLYYAVMNLAAILANKGLVEPAVAAWLPNIGMAGLAAWLLIRLR
jgi:lipopolysaccharide export system permease protein